MKLFKSSKPQIEFFTTEWYARKHYPVLPAREVLPDYWKRMSKNTELHHFDSARKCPGIGDWLGSGYIISSWTDIEIDQTNPEFGPQVRLFNGRESGSAHPPYQCLDLLETKSHHLGSVKLPGIWMIRTAPGWSIMLVPLWYWHNQPWEAMPGIMHSDDHHNEVNINMILKTTKEKVSIPAGTPLVQVIPFKREPVKAVSRAATSEDLKRHGVIMKMYEWTVSGITRFYRKKTPYTIEQQDLDFQESLKFPIETYR